MRKLLLFILTLAVCCDLVLTACSKKGTEAEEPQGPTEEQLQHLKDVQQGQISFYQEFERLITDIDTSAAKDSLALLIAVDTTVEWAQVSSQGIWIQYNCGMRGGVLIDPGHSLGGKPYRADTRKKGHVTVSSAVVPISKKTLCLVPIYSEAQNDQPGLIEGIKSHCNAALQGAGYDGFEIFVDGQCTVSRFCSMSGYGIVCIYSHAFAYPNNANIQEVYVLTGEAANSTTNEKYFDDIVSQNLPVVILEPGTNRYLIPPSLVGSKSDFSNANTLLYLGFCYSSRGTWPSTMVQTSHAIACLGYDWKLDLKEDSSRVKDFFDQMCDMSRETPLTVAEWYSSIDPCYHDAKEGRDVCLHYYGDGGTALWEKLVEIVSTNPADGATGVIVSTTIAAAFSADMDPSTITSSTFTVNNGVTGIVSYEDQAAVFVPSAHLAHNTTYIATIKKEVADLAGNHMAADYSWSFTTSGPGPSNCVRVAQGNWCFDLWLEGIRFFGFEGELSQSDCYLSFDYGLFTGTLTEENRWHFTYADPDGELEIDGHFHGSPADSFYGIWLLRPNSGSSHTGEVIGYDLPWSAPENSQSGGVESVCADRIEKFRNLLARGEPKER